MPALVTLSLVILGTSLLATLLVARAMGRNRMPSEVERLRIELDALLDELEPGELREVERVCRRLHQQRVDELRKRATTATRPMASAFGDY